ncbi:MAG: SDR family oxidoreductase [Pseudomonadota bacterium]
MAGYRDLGNRVVVITGASSGIGRAAARAFAVEGCRLVLAARNEAALDSAVRECDDLGGEAVAVAADVTDHRDVDRLAETALTRFGGLDVWVNDAAVTLFGRIEQVPLAEFDKVVRTNLMGTVHGCRAAIPVFRKQGHGVLINLSSVAGTVGQPETSAYVATKWAIRGLGESLRMELMDAPGIAVCTVMPPSVDTPLFQHGANHSGREPRPMPPVYSPERVAALIVELARHPRREAFVGRMAPLLALTHAVAPALAEKMMARTVEREHFRDIPAPQGSGNLFTPQADSVHGGWAGDGGSGRARTALAVAAGAAVAVPLGVLAWRRFQHTRGRSAYL